MRISRCEIYSTTRSDLCSVIYTYSWADSQGSRKTPPKRRPVVSMSRGMHVPSYPFASDPTLPNPSIITALDKIQSSQPTALGSAHPGLHGLLHLGDVELDVRLHLEVLVVGRVHLVLNVFLEIQHLSWG